MSGPSTVVIVGLGLIGGSVGLALRRPGEPMPTVIGVDLDPRRLGEALRRGAITEASGDLAPAVARADVVVICTPVPATVPLVRQAALAGGPNVLITDVGSTKARLVDEVEADAVARTCFVGSHPIAGSEREGVEHARADLFEGRVVALTPTSRTPPALVDRCRTFWTRLGATTIALDPVEHDHRLAQTSHLPHAVASALAALVPPEFFPLAAGAYRDGTRVAGAQSRLWAGILHDNRGPLLDALAAFRAELTACEAALAAGDVECLAAWWERGRARRAGFDDRRATTRDPDPGE